MFIYFFFFDDQFFITHVIIQSIVKNFGYFYFFSNGYTISVFTWFSLVVLLKCCFTSQVL